MKRSASNENVKRLIAFLLVTASYALAVITCAVTRPTDDVTLSVYVMGGIAVFLVNSVISFLPQVTDWYYENILPVFFHSPRGIRPRRWYAKLTPYYLIVLMVLMLVIIFAFAAV